MARVVFEEERSAFLQLAGSFELPPPSAEELRRLRASIASEGVLSPIIVSLGPVLEGEVADGRARLAVCLELGIECPREGRTFANEAKFHLYRLTTNLERRQLSIPELIRLGMALEPLERERAGARRAQAPGGRRGEKTLPVGLPEESGETRERVARLLGLGASTYERGAKVLREGSPELVARFQAGETVNRAYNRLRHEQQRAGKAALAAQLRASPPSRPDGRYPVVVIDPPWPYENLPYPVMNLEEIAALPVPELLSEHAIIWLWTTNRFLGEAITIATEQWGLVQRNILTWDKDRVGNGHWLLGQTEHCLLLTRGAPLFEQGNATTLIRERSRQHSRKPEAFYALVERTSPGPKLEMFARKRREGFEPWGAEVDFFPRSVEEPL